MGEQTQTQTQTIIDTPPEQSQPNSDSVSPPPPSAPSPVPDVPADLAKNPSNPSKIPIRPQKIRKLSTTATPSASASASSSTVVTDAFAVPTTDSPSSSAASNVITTASAPKNRRRSAFQSSRVLPQVVKPLSAEGEIEFAINHLRSIDPLLATVIDTHPLPTFDSHYPPFLALTRSILYQQLALKAGTSIYTRFVSLCGGEDAVLPDMVLSLSAQQLKQIGVSGRKASYLYDLANKYKNGILSDETIVKLDDRSLFAMLSMVKGIGSWSVHMFMIYSLHRPDVLPVSDLGVRKGVQLLYGLEELPRPSQMEQLCEKWRPYRSIGAWYMLRFVEGKGTPIAGAAVALEGHNVLPLQQIEAQQDGGQQHQLQLLEPINGMGNIGACIWGQ